MKKETFFFEGDPELGIERGRYKATPTKSGIASLVKNLTNGKQVKDAARVADDIEGRYSGGFPAYVEIWKGKFIGPKVFVIKGCYDEDTEAVFDSDFKFYFSVHEESKPNRLASDSWIMNLYPMGFRERRPRPGRDRW